MTRATKATKAQMNSLIGLLKGLAEFLRSEADNIAHTAELSPMSALTLSMCLNNSIRKVREELDSCEVEAKKIAAYSAAGIIIP